MWLIDELTAIYSAPADFVGQDLAYAVQLVLLGVGLVVGVASGYSKADFTVTFYVVLGFGIAAMVLTIPSWPFYRRHPIKWRTSNERGSEDSSAR